MRNAILLVGCLVLLCCSPRRQGSGLYTSQITDTIKYARGFNISQVGNIKILHVFNPWEGAKGIEYKYVLCPKGQTVPDSLRNSTIIYTPVSRIVCLSTTHIALLSFLDKQNTLVGVASPKYISDSVVQHMYQTGKVLDVGFDQALNYEILVSLKPDVVLAYGVQGETATQYKKLEELGIKVVLNGDYLESSPLGKLEWVKFLAAFYNVSSEASVKFNTIVKEYQRLAQLSANLKDKPTVMCGLPWKGAWYVPGGESYLAQMIRDAGGNYLWNDVPQRESIPISFEKVIERASGADYWVNTGNSNSLKDIVNEDPRLEKIKPYVQKKVFNNNALTCPTGGNDFWESGIVRPHIILQDLIKIFHPELLPDHSLVYYKKLN